MSEEFNINNNYIICIPTYQRYISLDTKTLKLLNQHNIDPDKIFIFVANEHEKELYEHKLSMSDNKYGQIIVGEKGIRNQRKFISKYFDPGQYIISMDDDVECLYIKKGDNKEIITDINVFFEYAHEQLIKYNSFLWGVYPTPNAYWMKEDYITTDLRYAIGVCHGYINRHDEELYPNILSEGKEDIETSILFYLKDKIIIRFNNISFKTKFNAVGGLGRFRFDMNKKAQEYLVNKYPNICSKKFRSNGMAEVVVKRNPNI